MKLEDTKIVRIWNDQPPRSCPPTPVEETVVLMFVYKVSMGDAELNLTLLKVGTHILGVVCEVKTIFIMILKQCLPFLLCLCLHGRYRSYAG